MADILTYNSLMAKNRAIADEIATLNAQASAGGGGGSRTWDPKTWTNLTLLPFCGLKGSRVIQNESNAGCGASCTWTVPAGATKVQFQVWGAGANGGAGECCGMGFPGGNAAYATITIDAVAGCQYVLCAGCALCCCLHYGAMSGFCTAKCMTPDNGLKACPSFVTGFGLTNFCAEGGMHVEACRYKETLLIDRQGPNWQSIITAKTCSTGNPMCNWFIGESLGTSNDGWCMYEGAPWICLGNANRVMAGCHPIVEECCVKFYGTTQGILGSYAGWQWYDTNNNSLNCQLQGRFCRGPVHSLCRLAPVWPGPTWFNHGGNNVSGRSQTFTGCTTLCCYDMPGLGGSQGFADSGNCGGGYRGTGGAVRVSWC